MSDYRRVKESNTPYFFTLVTYDRAPLFAIETNIVKLKESFKKVNVKHPFTVEAIVILPDHIHTIWSLPEDDTDYPTRWRLIKQMFSRLMIVEYPKLFDAFPGTSRANEQEKLIWQRRYWEHTIRDSEDFKRHLDYIHFNPVKHGYVDKPSKWRWSSFNKWLESGEYSQDWGTSRVFDIPGAEWD
ncbi:MAG: transposase [candidate division Zixibacteria bacterium]|nr:transposase [candidate division Zixibacteria bacterium]